MNKFGQVKEDSNGLLVKGARFSVSIFPPRIQTCTHNKPLWEIITPNGSTEDNILSDQNDGTNRTRPGEKKQSAMRNPGSL